MTGPQWFEKSAGARKLGEKFSDFIEKGVRDFSLPLWMDEGGELVVIKSVGLMCGEV